MRKENVYHNPFDNELALGLTDQGNFCRFGVFWMVAAHGERGGVQLEVPRFDKA